MLTKMPPREKGQRPISPQSGMSIFILLVLFHMLLHGSAPLPAFWVNTLKSPSPGILTPVNNSLSIDEQIDHLLQHMSLDEKLGQLFMMQFEGAVLSDNVRQMIQNYHVGAFLLFTSNGNIIDQQQLSQLSQQIKQQNTTIPPLLALDQEGGLVNRLEPLVGSRPSAGSIGETNETQNALSSGEKTATDLRKYGISLNLAPVVDVDTDEASTLHQDHRSYSSHPEIVSSMADAYLQGLQGTDTTGERVLGTLKHFPGLGGVTIDPHQGLPTLQHSRADLEQIEWAPYRTLIKNNQAHVIMVTHALVPAIDTQYPASLSRKLIQDVLRHDLGFQGVVLTDSLNMKGVAQKYSLEQAASLSLQAGADLLLGLTNLSELRSTLQTIKEDIDAKRLSIEQVDASVHRILEIKSQAGILKIKSQARR